MIPRNPSGSQCVESGDIFRARRYINENFADELSLTTLAKIANLSANYFSEKFKDVTGVNFAEYIARARVEKARDLLQNSNLRITAIAFDAGFQSLSQFNRVFKKITGQSPTQFRAAHAMR